MVEGRGGGAWNLFRLNWFKIGGGYKWLGGGGVIGSSLIRRCSSETRRCKYYARETRVVDQLIWDTNDKKKKEKKKKRGVGTCIRRWLSSDKLVCGDIRQRLASPLIAQPFFFVYRVEIGFVISPPSKHSPLVSSIFERNSNGMQVFLFSLFFFFLNENRFPYLFKMNLFISLSLYIYITSNKYNFGKINNVFLFLNRFQKFSIFLRRIFPFVFEPTTCI